MSTESGRAGQLAPAGPGAVATVAVGTFLSLVVFTLPLADLPTLARASTAGRSAQAWILSSMSAGLAASMLLAGALADDRGRRRVFAAGAVGMALGSLICAVSFGPVLFVAGRIVQGVGGSALIAAGLALLSAWSVDAVQRSKATALWGTSVGAGIAVGPVLAGSFDLIGWWREIYVVIVVASLMLLLHRRSAQPAGPDAGVDAPIVHGHSICSARSAFTAAMTLVLVGLTEIRQPGGQTLAVIMFVLAGGCVVAFVIIERRVGQPMINFSFFAEPRFAAASLAGLITGIGVIGQLSVTSSYLVKDFGLLPIGAAGLLALWSATSAVTALLSRRLPSFASGPRQLVIGLVGVTIGLALLIGARHPVRPGGRLVRGRPGQWCAERSPGSGGGAQRTGRAGRAGQWGEQHRSLSRLGGRGHHHLDPGARWWDRSARAERGWSSAAMITAAASAVGAALVALLLLRAPRFGAVSPPARELATPIVGVVAAAYGRAPPIGLAVRRLCSASAARRRTDCSASGRARLPRVTA